MEILIQIDDTAYEATSMSRQNKVVALEGVVSYSDELAELSLHEYQLALVGELLWTLSEDDLDKEKALEAIRSLFSGLDIQSRLDMKDGTEDA